METIEYRTMDKSSWGPGLWTDEPDKKQWMDEKTGLPCLVVRNSLGALCGYVGVSEGHPWFQRAYMDIDAEVHGGLTYSGECQPGDEARSICHIPGSDEPDHVWWLGFDCAHCFDVCPKSAAVNPHYAAALGGIYRTFRYVESEVAKLAHRAEAATAVGGENV